MKVNILITLLCLGAVTAEGDVETTSDPEVATGTSDESEQREAIENQQNEVVEEAPQKAPFRNPLMESIGLVLMLILIALSNAGGLSGAGSNIPIMLIFFDLDMSEAVPISAFVAVCATVFRFCKNFSQKHPNRPARNSINYEIVQLTMPCVFMGSFLGVILGKILGENIQIIIFGTTVAWSIYTTTKKAFELLAKEKATSDGDQSKEGLLSINDEDKDMLTQNTPEIEAIKHQEANHFTMKRSIFILINFSLLFVTQFLYGQKEGSDLYLGETGKKCVLGLFCSVMIGISYYSIKQIESIHEIKKRDLYNYDDQDTKFNGISEIAFLSFVCMIAAVLCGCTGIAGGMVLGPLFLKYNMVPSVMSGTNQFITMIASVSVAIQFAWIGDMIWAYAIIFGMITLVAAYIGITGINWYVKKNGGKQSIIAFMLVLVLVLAIVSLPINHILKQNQAAAEGVSEE